MTFSSFVAILKGRPQKYSKNRPPPLVRFSPRWAIPPPPPRGRPLWMTPFRRSLITVALSATIIAVRCLVAVKRVSQCGWLWLTMDCPCELTVVDRRPMRTRRMFTRSPTRCTATCSSRWKASVSSSGLSVSQSVSQSVAGCIYILNTSLSVSRLCGGYNYDSTSIFWPFIYLSKSHQGYSDVTPFI